jgi:hypothetical protein
LVVRLRALIRSIVAYLEQHKLGTGGLESLVDGHEGVVYGVQFLRDELAQGLRHEAAFEFADQQAALAAGPHLCGEVDAVQVLVEAALEANTYSS